MTLSTLMARASSIRGGISSVGMAGSTCHQPCRHCPDCVRRLRHRVQTTLSRVFDEGSQKTVVIDGAQFTFEESKDGPTEVTSAAGKSRILDNIIKSPMPGSVVKINVKEGDEVHEGDILIIVEAMKMENELRSPGSMKVKKVHVKEGEQVEGFVPLIELE